MNLVFVYGTLMNGFKNNYLLEDSVFLGDGETKDKFGLFRCKFGDFPFAIESIKEKKINGELYCVSNETLDELDKLENYPTLYDKKIVEINYDNRVIKAIMYIKNEKNYPDVVDYNSSIESWK